MGEVALCLEHASVHREDTRSCPRVGVSGTSAGLKEGRNTLLVWFQAIPRICRLITRISEKGDPRNRSYIEPRSYHRAGVSWTDPGLNEGRAKDLRAKYLEHASVHQSRPRKGVSDTGPGLIEGRAKAEAKTKPPKE